MCLCLKLQPVTLPRVGVVLVTGTTVVIGTPWIWDVAPVANAGPTAKATEARESTIAADACMCAVTFAASFKHTHDHAEKQYVAVRGGTGRCTRTAV